MIHSIKIGLRILPWVLLTGVLLWMQLTNVFAPKNQQPTLETQSSLILTKMEKMGKLELVKYSFQEVTEVKKVADYIDLKLFKYKLVPDAKAVLISQGSAAGCIDLTTLTKEDIALNNDTLTITLPYPELCYFKLDLEKSRIYDLQVDYMSKPDREAFVQELYRVAERQIRVSALQTGILEQSQENAELLLKPLFENISGKKVIIKHALPSVRIEQKNRIESRKISKQGDVSFQ